MKYSASDIEKWVVLPDIHLPYMDMKTMRAVEWFLEDNQFDGWLCLGDLLDFNEISKFNQDAPRRRTELVKQTFEAGNTFLDRQQKIIRKNNKNSRFVYLEGNHEFRVEDYMDRHEQLSGMLDVDDNLNLGERNIEWLRSWSKGDMLTLGNANFVHGLFTNQYHANKMASRFGSCIYYGHTHDVQEISLAMLGGDKTLVGKSLGCLCDINQKYMKGNPSNWQQAIAVFYIFPDGYYTEHTMRIFKHRFATMDGKIYDGDL